MTVRWSQCHVLCAHLDDDEAGSARLDEHILGHELNSRPDEADRVVFNHVLQRLLAALAPGRMEVLDEVLRELVLCAERSAWAAVISGGKSAELVFFNRRLFVLGDQSRQSKLAERLGHLRLCRPFASIGFTDISRSFRRLLSLMQRL